MLIHGLTRWVSSQQNNDDTVSHSLACSVYRLACHGDVHAHCDFSSARLSVSLPRTVISAALLLRFGNGRACFETSSAASKAMAGASAFCAARIAWSAQCALVTCVLCCCDRQNIGHPIQHPIGGRGCGLYWYGLLGPLCVGCCCRPLQWQPRSSGIHVGCFQLCQGYNVGFPV